MIVQYYYWVCHRFYSNEAARTNGGYRAAAYVIELRGSGMGNGGFLLPAEQVSLALLCMYDG